MLPGLDLTNLINLLNGTCRRSLEGAAALCVANHGSQVTYHHFLVKLIEDANGDIPLLLKGFGISVEGIAADLLKLIGASRRSGAATGERPVLSSSLLDLLQEGWLISSVELGESRIRSGAVLLALLSNPVRWIEGEAFAALGRIPLVSVKAQFARLTETSSETLEQASVTAGRAASSPASEGALAKYAVDFTGKARRGEIDPVFCRDREIRQVLDILGRRRKNNPICVGEAGVGKTAIVEGLALKVVEGDVPEFLANVEIFGLDMGLLQAGASVKGEFENRLKAVIQEVKASVRPIILFIDEAHTLIGAGGPQGGSDAANLLKPVLARGELRTIAATTWSEYKKYFEKDPALARRFQPVKLDEPSAADAATIIRGLRPAYEKAHGVYVRDDAVVASAELSARYLSGRQLPDKAIDVLDTACARVRLSLSSKPAVVDMLERRIATLTAERDARTRDARLGLHSDADREAVLAGELTDAGQELERLTERWKAEEALVTDILAARRAVNEASADDAEAARHSLREAQSRLDALTEGHPLVQYEVCPETVGAVISDWTGIPTGRMVRDESRMVQDLANQLRNRIRGQDAAIDLIHNGILAAKAQLHNPNSPMGVFLLVGPSGVGKTETALAVADSLFGGERFMTVVNMSEYQEKHSVSRLIGSPPGYVGYGTGGVLTEAVRQRPYSVVLLDEIEKADLEVMNLFYQVFDKGTLSDGEGREIDFRNTVIFMTSNLASEEIIHHFEQGVTSAAALTQAITPILARHLKPALLARMSVVPYFPVVGEVLADIVRMKLGRLADRLWAHHRMALDYAQNVVDAIAARCVNVESGARTIDHIIATNLLPRISSKVLTCMGGDVMPSGIRVDLDEDGSFLLSFLDRAAA